MAKTTGKAKPTAAEAEIPARPLFVTFADELLWERQQQRDQIERERGKPLKWHPVGDCIELLEKALARERFTPANWPIEGLPPADLKQEFDRLTADMGFLWLQTEINGATAADFQAKLDSSQFDGTTGERPYVSETTRFQATPIWSTGFRSIKTSGLSW